eukprot:5516645-Amphidinium_carterae.1
MADWASSVEWKSPAAAAWSRANDGAHYCKQHYFNSSTSSLLSNCSNVTMLSLLQSPLPPPPPDC